MTRTVEVFRQTLVAKAEMDRAAAKEAEAEARRAQGLDALTRAFEARAAALMEGVSAPATEMQATAEAVARTARRPSPAISPTSRGAPRTGEAAVQVLGAAIDLSRRSDQLSAEIHRFLAGVRAA